MKFIGRISKLFLAAVLVVVGLRGCFLTKIEPGEVGVRYNNATGAKESDLKPGWAWEIVGLQRIWRLPTRYLFCATPAKKRSAFAPRTTTP